MILPKRVPWESLAELDELCSWIYGPQADHSTKVQAKNRLCAWQVNTPLPHALESVLGFLNAILLEPSNPSAATLRQTYALALIRFVNGLVDPLQQGAFARPIYSLAAQIGLPAWIVELRHRSTHEDLPSLEVLRDAIHESMEWLLNRYFLPTLSPSASAVEDVELPPLAPLLSNYKNIMKAGLKDASIQGRNKAELEKLMKDAAIWITDVSALYAADSSVRGTDTTASPQRSKLAVQKFCEGLCDKGGLVPVSKGKRTQLSRNLALPPNQAIWTPLLRYLDQQNEYFASELFAYMLSLLGDNSLFENDPTFLATIASWTLWAVDELGDEIGGSRRECVRSLLISAGPGGGTPIVQALINALVAQDVGLARSVESLKAAMKLQRQAQWETSSMTLLEERQIKLKEALKLWSAQEAKSASVQNVSPPDEADQLPPGWTRISQSDWVSCPIGAPILS